MIIPTAALEELETAEASIMSHLNAVTSAPEDVADEDLPPPMPMMLAVLRAISTSRGLLQAQKMIDEMTTEIPVSLEHLPDRYCAHCGHEVGS